MTQREINLKNEPRITIFGAGSFGTAIAHLLASKGLDVLLWGRDQAVIDSIKKNKTNPKFLSGAPLASFSATTNIDEAVKDRAFFIFAIPCQSLRSFLESVKNKIPANAPLVNLAKGMEVATLDMPSEIFAHVLGDAALTRFASVSGPTFAEELYKNMPTGAVVASREEKIAEAVQRTLTCSRFRLYRLTDLTGVELGGALKNVMAIEVGIAEGLGFGHNTRAGVLTRCLHEMTEFGLAKGAKARTFSGLSGMGDLVLTCTGDLSRNRQVGLRIGRGEKVADVLASLKHAVEGVPTAKAVHQAALQMGLDMPNVAIVYKILHENFPPRQAVDELLSRSLKSEYEDRETGGNP